MEGKRIANGGKRGKIAQLSGVGEDLTFRKQNLGVWRKPGQTKKLQQKGARDSR
jgi:hypothetical protein